MMDCSLEESVVRAMDGTDPALFPYLPYILQDTWEIGTDPGSIIKLISKHFKYPDKLTLLDLGCGKGAVSVQVAKALGCQCRGIDAVPAFVEEARTKAAEFGVASLCKFEVGDIRSKLPDLAPADIIVLGAIGPVLGDYFQTLSALKACLRPGGAIIIDDGYIDDHSQFSHHLILKHSEVMKQIVEAGMELTDTMAFDRATIASSNDDIMQSLPARCLELAEKYPDKKDLFLDYIKKQEEESRVLEEEVVCTVMLLKSK